MPEGTPVKQVLELQKEGKTNTEIIRDMQAEGFTFQQISEALNQAVAKAAVEKKQGQEGLAAETGEMQPSVLYSENKEAEPEAPAPSTSQKPSFGVPSYQPQAWPQQPAYTPKAFGSTTEDVEEIAESIISEKWQKAMEEFGDIGAWKEKTTIDIESVKQELMRLENRFENLQKGVVGKIKEYDESVADVGVEIKALEKLLQNIIGPLTRNVKDLEKVTEKLKK